MPDIRVQAELRDFGDHWTAEAYGGHTMGAPVNVLVEGDTREEAEAAFRTAWNEADGTSWADDEFGFNVVPDSAVEGDQ